MIQWEYCALFGANKNERELKPNYPKLIYFTKQGQQIVELDNAHRSERPSAWQEADEAEYVAHIIATLGLDGWELTTTARGSSLEGSGAIALYFRRPIGA